MNSTLRVEMRYGEVNGQNYPVVCSSRTDNCGLLSSAAATARSANDDEFMGAIGRIHYDLRFELCWLCNAQQQREFDQCLVFHRQ